MLEMSDLTTRDQRLEWIHPFLGVQFVVIRIILQRIVLNEARHAIYVAQRVIFETFARIEKIVVVVWLFEQLLIDFDTLEYYTSRCWLSK